MSSSSSTHAADNRNHKPPSTTGTPSGSELTEPSGLKHGSGLTAEQKTWPTLGTTAHAFPPAGAAPSLAAANFLGTVLTRIRGARLIVNEGRTERSVPLQNDEVTVGRGVDCQVRVPHHSVSNVHAIVRRRGHHFLLIDAESQNGVYVNGIKVREHRLVSDDKIRLGGAGLRFQHDSEETPCGSVVPTQRRPVVIIPGFSGSELWNGNQRVWPNKPRLLLSNQQQIECDWANLRVGSLVRKKALVPGLTSSDSFASLIDFLTMKLGYRRGQDLLEFPYDWRQDNRSTAHLLAREIERWRRGRTNPTEPIVLLAHSMGGIVSRLYLRLYGGADAVERCVFLGTPHLGSVRALRLAIGGGVFPCGLGAERIRRLLLSFPSSYQLLPAYPAAVMEDGTAFMPFDEEPNWVPPQNRQHFYTAQAVREILDAPADDEVIPSTCIFGYGKRTPDLLTLQRRERRLHVLCERFGRAGDGAVPQLSATLKSAEVHPVVQRHASLHSDRNVMQHLRFELLERARVSGAAE